MKINQEALHEIEKKLSEVHEETNEKFRKSQDHHARKKLEIQEEKKVFIEKSEKDEIAQAIADHVGGKVVEPKE